MPKPQNCPHSSVDVSETWMDAEGQVRTVELPVQEVGTCLVCGKPVKRGQNGPWQRDIRKRAKALR
jgi:hypothetical protein